jgi:hypothetical protein
MFSVGMHCGTAFALSITIAVFYFDQRASDRAPGPIFRSASPQARTLSGHAWAQTAGTRARTLDTRRDATSESVNHV